MKKQYLLPCIRFSRLLDGNLEAQQPVAITTREIQFSGNKFNYSFPAQSFTQILIPVK